MKRLLIIVRSLTLILIFLPILGMGQFTKEYRSSDTTVVFNTVVAARGLEFDLTNTPSNAEGILNWNAVDGTLEVGMPGGVVKLQIGQELLVKVKAAEDISNGEVVYVSGAVGNNPEASLAQSNNLATAGSVLAIATEDIGSGQTGYVTSHGLVRDIPLPTATFTAGNILYLSPTTAGAKTNAAPGSPNYCIKLGYVLVAHNTEGLMLVNINEIASTYDNVHGLTATYIPYADANGFLSESSNLIFDGSKFAVVGEIHVSDAIHLFAYFGDSTINYTYAVADTWYHLTNASDSMYIYSELDGFSVSNDTIDVVKTADYDMRAKLGLDGGNTHTYAMRFYNVTQAAGIPVAATATMRGTGNFESINVQAYAHLTAGDKIVLQIKNISATSASVIKNGVIKIYYVHD